jgi:hypothetical protein
MTVDGLFYFWHSRCSLASVGGDKYEEIEELEVMARHR